MLVCVAADGHEVSPHFGQCASHVIAQIRGDQVEEEQRLDNPGHAPGELPRLLSSMGVEVVIAGGMGSRAREMFDALGIQVFVGAQGTVADALTDLAQGRLVSTGNECLSPMGHPDRECGGPHHRRAPA